MDNKNKEEPSVNSDANQAADTNKKLSPLFRSMSLSQSDVQRRGDLGRKRSSSECSHGSPSNASNGSNALEIDNVSLRPRRTGTFSSLLNGVQRTATSLIFSDSVTRKYEENLMSRSVHDISMELENETDSNDLSHLNNDKVDPATREITQTDHLNRRLLNSFLSRINSMSSAIVDPNDGNREIYTDDLLMDRILHRVESDKGKSK